ncbi:MAG TPA: galactose-1-phosphate uridylyltransferase, partial [bacterium]|nr:galactose-1-phosphate uridylyltransferase [bacterium]
MPQLRKDPVLGRWVIIATERGKRPTDFATEPEEKKGGFCPFDEGNEDKTPPEVMAYREPGTKPDTPGWKVRVVPNKFPALSIEGDLDRAGEGMYDKMNGVGAHEVVIETPEHDRQFADLPAEHV